MNWEYKVEYINDIVGERSLLNSNGAKGWELVGYVAIEGVGNLIYKAVFKRSYREGEIRRDD